MKIKKLVLGTLVTAVIITSVGIGVTMSVNAEDEGEVIMYRIYNSNNGEHFYTADNGEKDNLVNSGWNYEGFGFVSSTSGDPVFRLYNKNSGEHHYTMNKKEKEWLVGEIGWKDEGISWYSKDTEDNCTTPLYRLYNPNATGLYEAGSHHYTMNVSEKDDLVAQGWKYEGVSWLSSHSIGETSHEKEATCSESGYEGMAICVKCDKEFKGKTIPANNNHDVVYHEAEYEEKSNACPEIDDSITMDIVCGICGERFFNRWDKENEEWEGKGYVPSMLEHFNICHGFNISKEKIDEYNNEIERLIEEKDEYNRLGNEAWEKDDWELREYYYEKADTIADTISEIENERDEYAKYPINENVARINVPATITRILVNPAYYSCDRCNKTSWDGVHWK